MKENLKQWQDSAGSSLLDVSGSATQPMLKIHVDEVRKSLPTAETFLVLRMAPAATGGIVSFENSVGTILARLNPDGSTYFDPSYTPDEAAEDFWRALGVIASYYTEVTER
jgi:hypothetical protein